MKLRTTYGYDFNCSKIWGIELGSIMQYDLPGCKKGEIYWSIYSRYASQRRMLQALKQFKEEIDEKYFYRPVHIDYSYELSNLDDKSQREYNLNRLLKIK